MNDVTVYLLTEGGSGIGFGHAIRCFSLGQAFEARGVNTKLLINGDDLITKVLPEEGIMVHNWIENRDELLDQIENRDLVVIDSYLAQLDVYGQFSKHAGVSAFLDDYNRLTYPPGVVINGSIGADKLDYPKRSSIIYLLGTEYQILRKYFWKVPEKMLREEARSVMITFGGEDVRNLTPRILGLLNCNFPELVKYVIIGRGFKEIEEIERVGDEKTRLIYYPDAAEMGNVMLEADIAISSGGQTLYELARIGVPTIAISTAQNQMTNVNGWMGVGFIVYAGQWDNDRLPDLVDISIGRILDFSLRQRMQAAGKRVMNGQGSLVVADYLLDHVG